MKKMIKLFALLVVMLSFAATTFAQVTAQATATATIITPIAIAKTVDMNFGNVAVSAVLGTVVLDPASARTPTGGCTLPAITGTVTAASFNVTGEGDLTYSITLPVGVATLIGAGVDMTVDTWTSTPTPTGTLTAGGTQTLTVGGTLNVGASQAAGTYVSGNFDVTVNYN